MKAIETIYNGYKFRSRLEARWAVFFYEMGIDFRYEAEGVNLGKTGWYLPDFWFPHPVEGLAQEGWGLWAEINPYELNKTETEKVKALCLMTKHNVLAIQGSPWPQEYTITKWHYWGHADHTDISTPYCDISLINGRFDLCRGLIRVVGVRPQDDWSLVPPQEINSYPMAYQGYGLDDAYKTARQARFEHGETPTIIT